MALKAFKPLQEKGTLETLKRAIQKMNEIMTFALHREIIQHNPLINISKEFDSPTVEHFKTIKPEDLSEFLFTLNTAQIQLQTRYLILWQLLTMTRPHINQDRIRMAYNRADYIKQRFEILQAWADFIDECSQGALPQYHLKKVA